MNKGKDIKEKSHLPFAMTEKEGHDFLQGVIQGRLSAQKSVSLAKTKSLSFQITTINSWSRIIPCLQQ